MRPNNLKDRTMRPALLLSSKPIRACWRMPLKPSLSTAAGKGQALNMKLQMIRP
jgi:hypothetical protein